MQEHTWARLRDSCPGTRAIHATFMQLISVFFVFGSTQLFVDLSP